MKNLKPTNAIKLTLCAGAVTLAALAPQVHAQSADALIDKLVEKGILTSSEASDLRDQADKDFKTAFAAKTGMPDWVTGYKFSGDVRGRFEQFSGDNNMMVDRTRLRYRVRLGVAVNMLDNLEVGLRLGSGDSSGNPLSSNTTMENNATKKPIWVDAAYGKWTMLHSGGWLLAATVGKMDNPFSFTPMMFDSDLTPEGAALAGSYTFNDKHSIAFAGGAFVLDEEGSFGKAPGAAGASSSQDPFMYGGQITWNAKWAAKWATSVGLGAFAIVSPRQLSDANVARNNQGNTRTIQTINYPASPNYPAGSAQVTSLVYNYTPLIANASVTYTADSFPFYKGTFPIKFAAEFMNNPGAPQNNNAFWVGVTLGKSGTKKTWDLSYRYEYLEADAWYDQLVDDDNGAFYATGAYSSLTGSAGWFGGTNIKGHHVKLNYSFTDSFTFSVACFINDLIIPPTQNPSSGYVVDLKSGSIRFMADLMWKF
ncbi:MAG: putative porin [Verrucomicrobiota bacterium]